MADVWYIQRGDQTFGPFTAGQLRAMTGTGQLLPVDLVARGDGGKWVPASQVKGLFAPPVAEPPVAPAAPAEGPSESFDFEQPASAPKSSRSKRGGTAGPTLIERFKSLVGSLNRKAKIGIAGGLLLLFVVGGSCVMLGGKSGTNTAGKSGSPGGSRGALSAAARENSEYKRGYKIGSDLGKRLINGYGDNLNDPRVRPSAMKQFNKQKRDTEKSYEDLLRVHGPDNDGTLLYRGMLDGYTEEVTKAGVVLD
jgi:hypothetical protein